MVCKLFIFNPLLVVPPWVIAPFPPSPPLESDSPLVLVNLSISFVILFKFDSVEIVIEAENDTEFGLAAYFYAKDLSKVWKVAEALEYGIVGINTGLISTEVAPFGGIKQSGLGREGSKYGIDDFIEIKYVNMCGLDK